MSDQSNHQLCIGIMDPDTLLTPREIASVIMMTVAGIKRLRQDGMGPTYLKLGYKTIRYRAGDVVAWLNKAVVSSPSTAIRGAAAVRGPAGGSSPAAGSNAG